MSPKRKPAAPITPPPVPQKCPHGVYDPHGDGFYCASCNRREIQLAPAKLDAPIEPAATPAVPAQRPDRMVTICNHVLDKGAKPFVYRGDGDDESRVVCKTCLESETDDCCTSASYADLDGVLHGGLAALLGHVDDDSLATAPDDSEPEVPDDGDDEPVKEDPEEETKTEEAADEADGGEEDDIEKEEFEAPTPGGGLVSTNSEMSEDAPKIVRARWQANLPVVKPDIVQAKELQSKEIVAKRKCEKHGVDGCAECFPPIDHAERERKREEENRRLRDEIRDRNRPAFAATVDTIPIEDAIRNEWELELQAQKHTTSLIITDIKETLLLVDSSRENLRAACNKTPRDLANLIKNEKFLRPIEITQDDSAPKEAYRDRPTKQKPITKVISVVGPDGKLQEHPCKVVPMNAKARRMAGRSVPLPVKSRKPKAKFTTALTDKEHKFYCDFAARNLSVDEMVKRHGAWTDDQIRELENKIVRHLVKVGLIDVLPDISTTADDDKYNRQRDEDEATEVSWISKTGGGLRTHRGKLSKYAKQRGLDSFRTAPPETGKGWDAGTDKDTGKGVETDDYGEDSAA